MCLHLDEAKISFKEYVKKKMQGETIYFFCKECNKLFVEKNDSEIGGNNMILMFIAYSTVILLEQVFEASLLIKVLVALLFLAILCFVQLLLKWKFLSFETFEISENLETVTVKSNKIKD